jgi:hypothetical protein
MAFSMILVITSGAGAEAAQVGWQVMIPNEENDVRAIYNVPLSQWGHEGQFNTLQECLAYREELFRQADRIEQAVGRRVPKWEAVRAAQCISTDDPRIKVR